MWVGLGARTLSLQGRLLVRAFWGPCLVRISAYVAWTPYLNTHLQATRTMSSFTAAAATALALSLSVLPGLADSRSIPLVRVFSLHVPSRSPHKIALAAAGVTLIAFLPSLSSHITLRLFASLASFLGGTVAFIAFLRVVDVALYAYVKSEVGRLDNVDAHTDTAPGT